MLKILGIDYKVKFDLQLFTLFIPDVCVIYIAKKNSHSYCVRMFFYRSKCIFCIDNLRSKNSAIAYAQHHINFLMLN